jgi:hypothetical protein
MAAGAMRSGRSLLAGLISNQGHGGEGRYRWRYEHTCPLTQWLLWAWLSGLTLLAAALAESGQLSQHWLAPLVLGFAWLKGWAVIEHYMGLRHAPRWLRAGVHGWLLLVTGVLLLSFR